MSRWLLVGCALVLSSSHHAAEKTELHWIKFLSKRLGGVAEHRTPDGSRVDILTDTEAWEVEHPHKWKEAVGQAHFYALATNRKPGIILLLKGARKFCALLSEHLFQSNQLIAGIIFRYICSWCAMGSTPSA